MIVSNCAHTSIALKGIKPSSPCPEHDLTKPLVQLLHDGWVPSFYPESKDFVEMHDIMYELTVRDRCHINWREKYDESGLFTD